MGRVLLGGCVVVVKVLVLLCGVVGRGIKKGNVEQIGNLFKSSIGCWVIYGFSLVGGIVYFVFVGCGQVDFVGVGRGVIVYSVGLYCVVFIFKILGLGGGSVGYICCKGV